MKKILSILISIFFSVWVYAQEYNMGEQDIINTCSGNFYDSGGPDGTYSSFNEESSLMTICPDEDDMRIQVDFSTFLLLGDDALHVYDGDSTDAPLIDIYEVGNIPDVILAGDQNTSGCLTFELVLDGSFSPGPGWQSEISCIEQCQTIDANITEVSPSTFDDDTGSYTVSFSDEVTFTADVIFEDSPAGAQYNWDFGDGETANGINVSHLYDGLGTFTVELEVIDENGCSVTVSIQLEIVFADQEGDCMITTVNYDFEEPTIMQSGYPSFIDDVDVPGWSTTASDGVIEFWPNSTVLGGINAYSGNQYIELNANEVSGVYQDYQTPVEGTEFSFIFAHAARNSADSGEDVVGVYAGSPGGTLTLVSQYSSEIDAGWSLKVGSYTVPAGQPVTRFEFRAISTATGSPTTGNYLDAIQFTANFGIISENPLSISCVNTINVEALGVGQWVADNANNPSSTVIDNPNSGTTTISGLDNIGTYTFNWVNEFCEDTLTVEVTEGDITLNTESVEVLGGCNSNTEPSFNYDLSETLTEFIDNPEDYEVSYYENSNDAQDGNTANSIDDPESYSFPNDIEVTVFVRIQEPEENCYRVVDINGVIYAQPSIQNIESYAECSVDDEEISIDLTANNSDILGDQTNPNFIITYYESESDALADDNEITNLDNYVLQEGCSTLYAKIKNSLNEDCFDVSPFQVCLSTVSVISISNLEECDSDSNGSAVFDLTQNDSVALGADQGSSDYSVSYYEDEASAEAGTPAIG
ncbi:PKD domain-containing protein, partial [Mesonia aquimarina]|uniref:PKD domain-containing protein n=1 Tax=Mesonia aquimarina TaxID=1504967 RepID=UPI0013CE64BF